MGRTVPTLAQWVRIAALLGSGLRAVAQLVRDPGTVRDPLARQVWRAELERLGWRRSQ